MTFQHIISTMYRNDYAFIEEMHLETNALVVNQGNEVNNGGCTVGGNRIHFISNTDRGLSNSRNMLLKKADADVLIMGDDDLQYTSGYLDYIQKAYEIFPDADVISFRFTENRDKETRETFRKAMRVYVRHISKIASVEITFKRQSVLNKNIEFDPLLGIGARFGSGEENAFLADCLRAGLKIYHVPVTICYTAPTEGDRIKWKDGFNEAYFIKKGACFYRIYGALFPLMCSAFLLLKKQTLFRNVPLFKAFGWLAKGKKEYIIACGKGE